MMTVKEFYITREDGIKLFKTYSDEGYMIQKIGAKEVYDEVIGVETVSFTYVETDRKIEALELVDEDPNLGNLELEGNI